MNFHDNIYKLRKLQMNSQQLYIAALKQLTSMLESTIVKDLLTKKMGRYTE